MDGHAGQFKTLPESDLTALSLVDTGELSGVGCIDRGGLEGAWLRGSWLVHSEYPALHAVRSGHSAFDSHGWYLAASWILAGESCRYKETAFKNPVPTHSWGAIGLALHYLRVDLTHGNILGGSEHDWTPGLNWYIGKHFELQANEVLSTVEHGNLPHDPRISELRAQVTFRSSPWAGASKRDPRNCSPNHHGCV